MKPPDYLSFYATRFQTVEVDSTYYGPPSASTVTGWRDKTPPDFLFAAKVPQAITHEKVLVDCEAQQEEIRVHLLREEKPGCDQRIFFNDRNIRCDAIGRASVCRIPGTPVGFKILKAISRLEETRQAADVHPIFDDPLVGNPRDHREVSHVDRFLVGTRVAGFFHRAGTLQGKNGLNCRALSCPAL